MIYGIAVMKYRCTTGKGERDGIQQLLSELLLSELSNTAGTADATANTANDTTTADTERRIYKR